MMIAIGTTTVSAFDRLFPVSDDSQVLSQSRRSSRTPTLDGGAVLVDSGYSVADETVQIKFMADMTLIEHELLRQLTQLYSTILLFLPQGAYLAHPKTITPTNWTLELLSIAEIK